MRIANGNTERGIHYLGLLRVETTRSAGKADWYATNHASAVLATLDRKLTASGFSVAYSNSNGPAQLTDANLCKGKITDLPVDYGVYTRKTGGHRWEEVIIAHTVDANDNKLWIGKGNYIGSPVKHKGVGFPKFSIITYDNSQTGAIQPALTEALHKAGLERLVK